MKQVLLQLLEEYTDKLAPERGDDYVAKKENLVYNYIVTHSPNAAQVKEFCSLLFDNNETVGQIKQRLQHG